MVTKMLQLFGCARLRLKHSGAGLLSALLACAFLAGPALAADPRESGPRSLVITYHTSPANRLAFRQELEQSGVRQLQRWKDDGVLQSYRVLFNRYVDSANWDAMTMVTFAKESDIERWKKIELEAPAGLSQKALSLVTSIDTVSDGFDPGEYPVRLVVEGRVIDESCSGTVSVLDCVDQSVDTIHHVIDAAVQFVVGNQFAHRSISVPQVTNEGVRFPHRRVCVIVNRGIG